MRDAKPFEQRFGAVQSRLQSDPDWILLRSWCRLWKIPPNDPRVLDMPIAEMEDWLLANGLEAWVAQDESRSLRSATAEEVYPDLNESFAQVYARVLEQMGGAEHADPDEVLEETRRRMNSEKDVS